MRMSDWLRRGLLLIVLMAAPLLAVADTGNIQRILVLHSQAPNHPWIAPFSSSLKRVLLHSSVPTEMYEEYLDYARFQGPKMQAGFMSYLANKYSVVRPDIIVADGAYAINFAHDLRERIAPEQMIVAIGAKVAVRPDVLKADKLMLADTSPALADNFELIKRLRPQTRRLIIVGQLPIAVAQEILRAEVERSARALFPEVIIHPQMQFDLLLKEIATLPQDTSVLLFGFVNDADGQPLSSLVTGTQLAKISPVPVFTVFDSTYGTGVLGGKMVNGAAQGEAVAAMIEQLLTHTPANTPLTINPHRTSFDYQTLQRFGMDTNSLPEGSEIINRPPSLYETNPSAVIAGGAAFLLLAVLLIALSVILRLRHKTAQTMTQLNLELEERVAQRSIELKQAMVQLMNSEKLASLGSLVAGIAHELNTPLGNAQVVASTFNDHCKRFAEALNGTQLTRGYLREFAAQSSEASDLITRNVQRAAELIASFKQNAVDQASERKRQFMLGQLIKETLHTLSPSLQRAPVKILTELNYDPSLDSHPGALAQVLTNLINNAIIHARGDKPLLTITLRSDAGATPNTVALSVCDDGVGMSEAVRQRIFDPFFTTRLGQGGSGLGLYLVQNLVTASMGGTLEVDSREGEGSCFRMQLPLLGPDIVAAHGQ